MNKKNILTVSVFFIIILFLILYLVKLNKDLGLLENEVKDLESTVENKNKNIESLNEELNVKSQLLFAEEKKTKELSGQLANYQNLNEELLKNADELNEKIENLNWKLGNIDITLEEIEEHEESIRDSMSWFQTNTDIEEIDEYYSIRSGLNKFCIRYEDGYCEIKTVCLRLINEVFNFLKYRQDVVTSGKIDFLQNLTNILKSKGGDCEDFSLLTMAELNYLKDKCEDRELRFESFDYAEGYSVFADYTDKYILDRAKSRKIDEDLNEFYVVCGNFPGGYDPNKRSFDIFGHCVLGISNMTINSSDEVADFLRNAVLVEPQDGSFIIDLRNGSIFEIPEHDEPKSVFFLRIVITDKDLYRFDMNELRWLGYEDYINRIDEAKEKIRKIG